VIVGVLALGITFMKNKVSVRHAVHAHVHYGLVAHAHRHTAIAASFVAFVGHFVAFLTISILAHAILVVIIRLTACTFWTHVNQAFLRTMQMGLLIGLHRLLLRVNLASSQVSVFTQVDLRSRQTNDSNLLLAQWLR